MKNKSSCLPIYGVGPYYGGAVLFTTLCAVLLIGFGFLKQGTLSSPLLITVLRAAGIFLFFLGILLWAGAATGKKCIDRYIRANVLCTDGMYRYVRNPCYSGILLASSDVLLLFHNGFLLLLPLLYWLGMTVLMKHTEEKWLYERYGDSYLAYCRRVNRCIPWVPKH